MKISNTWLAVILLILGFVFAFGYWISKGLFG